MRIVNRTDRRIAYELKGGPLRMTLSTCELAPGESEDWESPYRRQHLDVACELHVTVGDTELVTEAGEDDTVSVVAQGTGFALERGAGA